MTKILRCSCKHAFQDKRYGRGLRVFNQLKAENQYRCTACNRVK